VIREGLEPSTQWLKAFGSLLFHMYLDRKNLSKLNF